MAPNFALIDTHPDRTPYLQHTSVPPLETVPNDDPLTPVVTTERIRILDTTVATVHARVSNPTGAPVVVATLTVGAQVVQQTLATDSVKGASYDVEWHLQAPGASGTGADVVTLPAAAGTVVVGAGFGTTAAKARATIVATRVPAVRQQIPFEAGERVRLLLPTQPARRGPSTATRRGSRRPGPSSPSSE